MSQEVFPYLCFGDSFRKQKFTARFKDFEVAAPKEKSLFFDDSWSNHGKLVSQSQYCPICKRKECVKPNGKTEHGTQQYLCGYCRNQFTR